ncbi:MAG: phosphatidylserine decarboxylase [Verrucomicrobiia bacterium]
MKHSGKALLAALRLISLAGAAVVVLLVVAFLAKWAAFVILNYLLWALVALWGLFVVFTFYFFRDPDPLVPTGPNLVVSPGHGKVDVIDTTTEPDHLGGECRRISIFLSVIDIHVQYAPVTGRVALCKYTPGQFLSALKTESAQFNENLLIGFDAAEPRGEKIGVRLIAGLIARRIVPWLKESEAVQRGERISLIQFGSRVDVYLPRRAKIKVKLGDKVVGGETVIASFD